MATREAPHSEQTVRVSAGNVDLDGTLTVPPVARGVVLFAHGSGSSRHGDLASA